MHKLKNYGDIKNTPISISQKNVTIRNIFNLVMRSHNFLVLGHSYSDVDCISSMLAISLLLRKFHKYVTIYVKDHFPSSISFFQKICEYNDINLLICDTEELEKPDAIFILDTPKPEMISLDDKILSFFLQKSIPKIEIDHHFSQDARHSGDIPYRLTLRASSAAEIIAHICQKISKHKIVLEKHAVGELYSRNIVMVMAAGMMGDAKKGGYLATKRDISFFKYFLNKFDAILKKTSYKGSTNVSSVDEMLELLEKMSQEEKHLYDAIKKEVSFKDNIGLLILDEKTSYNLYSSLDDFSVFIEIIRNITDELSNIPNDASVSCFYYPPSISSFIEFRVRASENLRGIDFRSLINIMKVPDGNGGGHPGAICFKIEKHLINDIKKYVASLISNVENIISEYNEKKHECSAKNKL